MNKVLSKRILRDLKENFMRYLALIVMIILCMYIIVSVVAAADTIIDGSTAAAEKNMVEDGHFSVFLPLTSAQEKEITDKGVTLEKMSYIDVEADCGGTLRIFRNRKSIDLIDIDNGRTAETTGEAFLEKRYCEEHDLSVGDTVTVLGSTLDIVGTGSVPDYDAPVKSISDVSAESSLFGLAFVTDEQYSDFLSCSVKAEESVYAYRLNGKMTDEELKELIRGFAFDYNDVEDKYYREAIADTIGRKDDLRDGINEFLDGANEMYDGTDELYDGTKELYDGLGELNSNSSKLNDGASEIFDAYIAQAGAMLSAQGVPETLTADNYGDILDKYAALTGNAELTALKETLDSLKEFADGTVEYTDGVKEAYDGSDELRDGAKELRDGASELRDGVQELKDQTDDVIDEFFTVDLDNLTEFVKRSDNQRILGAANDVVTNKTAGLLSGVVILMLFTYVISVFIIHQIQSESSVIGALYALGVKKKDLIVHYLTLPTIVTLIGGAVGTYLGFCDFGARYQMQDSYSYFSLPELDTVHPLYLIIYGIVMPPLVCIIVNYIVINGRLSRSALSLIRNEQNTGTFSHVELKGKSFVRNFCIRQVLREMRTSVTVATALFICMMLFMLGADCYVLCSNVDTEIKADTRYEYMYMLKYPEKTVPAGAESAYIESLSKTEYDNTLDVTIMGIDEGNKYFDYETVKGRSNIVMSRSVQQKYGLKVGDKLILSDNANEMDYAFTIKGVADYSAGLTVFMDIDSMRELFDKDDDYYNVLYSDAPLDIDEGRLYSIQTKDDIYRSSDVFIRLMMPMIIMISGVSVIIFCVVLFLMINVMIDRAGFGISLIKIFGFRTKEIKRLYLNGNTAVIAVSSIIFIPLSKKIIDKFFPVLVANVSSGTNLTFKWYYYLLIFVAVMVIYSIINAVLVGKLKKITPAEVLKNRE